MEGSGLISRKERETAKQEALKSHPRDRCFIAYGASLDVLYKGRKFLSGSGSKSADLIPELCPIQHVFEGTALHVFTCIS